MPDTAIDREYVMLKRIIEASIKLRALVLLALLLIIAAGIFSFIHLPVNAFPDISPVMVPVFAEAHGMAPEEVERLITFPVESSMNGLPGITLIKSTSAFGMSAIYIYFRDDIDIYFARQLVAERLTHAAAELPELHELPKLGPISTGLGQIFIYYLTLEEGTDTEGKAPDVYLREVNDWIVKYQLQTVPGVTDILSIGGHVLQYQIEVDPHKLEKFNVSLQELVEAVRNNNRNAGGQFLLMGQEEFLVRGIGMLGTLDEIRDIHIRVNAGIPVMVGDVARVQYGKEIRRGVVSRNGEKEVVSGIVMQLLGENTSAVIDRLYKKIPALQESLPEGVRLVPYYEQAELVGKATWTMQKALFLGALLVVATLGLFLGRIRTALIVALALPVSALFSVLGMTLAGISANLMSLGGIAIGIGMLGDGTIVVIENIYRRLQMVTGDNPCTTRETIIDATHEVARPVFFSIFIIIIVFLPIFTLENVEGKMFSPLASTLTFALLGSLAMSIIAAPVLASFLLTPRVVRVFALTTRMKSIYRKALSLVLNRRKTVLLTAIAVFLCSIAMVPFLGTEFIPVMEEGSILIGVTMPRSISLDEAVLKIQKLERIALSHEEVSEVISRIGRPEAGSHPHPVNYAEMHIELSSGAKTTVRSKAHLVEELSEELSSPGIQLNFTQPIQNAFDELLSGVKAQLAIKVFGENLTQLEQKATEIYHLIEDVPGLVDLSLEQAAGQQQVQVTADREACSRYGVSVDDIVTLVELAIGGEVIDTLYLNTRKFAIHVRYQERYRDDLETIRNLRVRTETGNMLPLKHVADVTHSEGPFQINREHNQRRWTIQGNIRGRDLGSVVADIRERVTEEIDLPPGYHIEYGGQFENQQRAMVRLAIIIPVVLALVFLLIFIAFRSFPDTLLIYLSIPLALTGGILGLKVTGEYLSVPSVVGFIALLGISVQNSMVMLSCINQQRENFLDRREAILEGAVLRLRPVLMTAITTILGLLPLLLSRGIGSDVQRPLSVVVIFGLITATLSTLFIVPAAYGLIKKAGSEKECD